MVSSPLAADVCCGHPDPIHSGLDLRAPGKVGIAEALRGVSLA
jgi:hypothetical protein